VVRAEDEKARVERERQAERDNYLRLCQQAADAHASGASFRQIATAQGCSLSTAHHRRNAWFAEVAKTESVELMRQSISSKFDYLFALGAQEIELVKSAPLEGVATEEAAPPIPGLRLVDVSLEQPQGPSGDEEETQLTLAQRVYLISAIMRRMTEVCWRHARVLGLTKEQMTLNVGPGAGASVLAMTKIEVPDDPAGQQRTAECLRDLSRLVGLAEP